MKRSVVIASFGVVAATSLALGVYRHPFALGSAGATVLAETGVQSNVNSSAKAAQEAAVMPSAVAVAGHAVKSQPGNEERAKTAKKMKTPAMRNVIRSTQKEMVDLTYGPFFSCLHLTEGDLASFKSLLTDKQVAIMDVWIDSMDQSLSEAERKKNIKDIREDFKSRIKTLLGEENYGVYRKYEGTQPERTQVTMFKSALSGDAQLNQQQEHDLVRALYEEREKFTFSTDLGDPKKAEDLDMSAISDEMISQYMADLAKLETQSEARVAAILTPAQLQQFKQNQKKTRQMVLSAMNMARTMFGAKAK